MQHKGEKSKFQMLVNPTQKNSDAIHWSSVGDIFHAQNKTYDQINLLNSLLQMNEFLPLNTKNLADVMILLFTNSCIVAQVFKKSDCILWK